MSRRKKKKIDMKLVGRQAGTTKQPQIARAKEKFLFSYLFYTICVHTVYMCV